MTGTQLRGVAHFGRGEAAERVSQVATRNLRQEEVGDHKFGWPSAERVRQASEKGDSSRCRLRCPPPRRAVAGAIVEFKGEKVATVEERKIWGRHAGHEQVSHWRSLASWNKGKIFDHGILCWRWCVCVSLFAPVSNCKTREWQTNDSFVRLPKSPARLVHKPNQDGNCPIPRPSSHLADSLLELVRPHLLPRASLQATKQCWPIVCLFH